ncbi:MAG: GAF domain-containing protein [Chloroflexota bacterium]
MPDDAGGPGRSSRDTLVPGSDVKIRSFLGVPLLISDHLIGALTLVHRDPGHFTETDKRQLSKLTAQASIAIENAIQVRERENALKQQIRQLQIEIDETKKARQVEEIVDTEYFQKLKERAMKMRKEAKDRDS